MRLLGSRGETSRTVFTNFPATENPISQGSIWTPGSTFSAGAATKTNIQTAGKAYSTMVSFDGTNFDDSLACLSGFGANHEVTCTIANSGGFSGFSLELEILLRSDITAAHVFQYEVDCVFGALGIDLVRWDMTIASPNSNTNLRARIPNETPFNNGDQVYASIVGTLITVKYRTPPAAFATLFTYDTVSDATKYSSGNPGIGAWNQTGSAANQSKFAWADFLANTL
jgi:hypothetical protein